MTPFFSIIIPTYNSALVIHQAIESVLCQTFRDFEIIVMDGNSKDQTLNVVHTYTDERIQVLSQPDKGVYDAMNKGIQVARGKWLYFMGSDDKLMDAQVLGMVSLECQGPEEIIYGNVYSKRFNGVYDGEFNEEKILRKNICHQSIFIAKTAFGKVGYFDIRYKTQADWDHNMRWFFSKKVKPRFINHVIADYADGGISSQFGDPVFSEKRVLNYLWYGKRTIRFSKKVSILAIELKKAVTTRNYKLLSQIIVRSPAILLYV